MMLRPLCASMSWTGKISFSFNLHIHLVSARKYVLASLKYKIVFPNRGFAFLYWTVTAMIFRCVRMAAYVLISFFMFVRLAISARPQLDGIPLNLIWETFMKICRKSRNFFKAGQICRSVYMKTEVRWLLASFNCHKSALIQWNGIRQLKVTPWWGSYRENLFYHSRG